MAERQYRASIATRSGSSGAGTGPHPYRDAQLGRPDLGVGGQQVEHGLAVRTPSVVDELRHLLGTGVRVVQVQRANDVGHVRVDVCGAAPAVAEVDGQVRRVRADALDTEQIGYDLGRVAGLPVLPGVAALGQVCRHAGQPSGPEPDAARSKLL